MSQLIIYTLLSSASQSCAIDILVYMFCVWVCRVRLACGNAFSRYRCWNAQSSNGVLWLNLGSHFMVCWVFRWIYIQNENTHSLSQRPYKCNHALMTTKTTSSRQRDTARLKVRSRVAHVRRAHQLKLFSAITIKVAFVYKLTFITVWLSL